MYECKVPESKQEYSLSRPSTTGSCVKVKEKDDPVLYNFCIEDDDDAVDFFVYEYPVTQTGLNRNEIIESLLAEVLSQGSQAIFSTSGFDQLLSIVKLVVCDWTTYVKCNERCVPQFPNAKEYNMKLFNEYREFEKFIPRGACEMTMNNDCSWLRSVSGFNEILHFLQQDDGQLFRYILRGLEALVDKCMEGIGQFVQEGDPYKPSYQNQSLSIELGLNCSKNALNNDNMMGYITYRDKYNQDEAMKQDKWIARHFISLTTIYSIIFIIVLSAGIRDAAYLSKKTETRVKSITVKSFATCKRADSRKKISKRTTDLMAKLNFTYQNFRKVQSPTSIVCAVLLILVQIATIQLVWYGTMERRDVPYWFLYASSFAGAYCLRIAIFRILIWESFIVLARNNDKSDRSLVGGIANIFSASSGIVMGSVDESRQGRATWGARICQILARIKACFHDILKVYHTHCSVSGKYFFERVILFEFIGVTNQIVSLFTTLRYLAQHYIFMICSLLLLNCICIPIAIHNSHRESTMIFDTIFEGSYAIYNAIRMVNLRGTYKPSISDVSAFMVPMVAASMNLGSLASWKIYRRWVRHSSQRNILKLPSKAQFLDLQPSKKAV